MIDPEVKKKVIEELGKSGNVYFACAKNNIGRATYYRWYKEDPKFRAGAKEAFRNGRENICDVAEHALLQKVKEKDMVAIKYTLSHNSPRYRPSRQSKVIIEHVSNQNSGGNNDTIGLNDLLRNELMEIKKKEEN